MAIPKYQYIKDELKNKIISGQFASGDKFYTEAELISMYDVSSITVVRALNDLAKDGYIVRQQGKGTINSITRLNVFAKQMVSLISITVRISLSNTSMPTIQILNTIALSIIVSNWITTFT